MVAIFVSGRRGITMGRIIALCLVLFLCGCAITAESLKKLPDVELFYRADIYTANLYRQEFVRRHPEWSEKIKQNVLNGNIFIGMTKEQARASWGEPYDINRTTTQWRVKEQWVYGGKYLYFDDEMLTTIQN